MAVINSAHGAQSRVEASGYSRQVLCCYFQCRAFSAGLGQPAFNEDGHKTEGGHTVSVLAFKLWCHCFWFSEARATGPPRTEPQPARPRSGVQKKCWIPLLATLRTRSPTQF